jgi:hypothetical protein
MPYNQNNSIYHTSLYFYKRQWVIVQMSYLTTISWMEQVIIRWDDNDIHFVIIVFWHKGENFKKNYFLIFHPLFNPLLSLRWPFYNNKKKALKLDEK